MKLNQKQRKYIREYMTKRRRAMGILSREETTKKNGLMFLDVARKTHPGLYDYSSAAFSNMNTKVSILCYEHGIFEQTPTAHVHNRQGCPKCAQQSRRRKCGKPKKTIDQFISEANIIHHSLYNYNEVRYVNVKTKVQIGCNIHGIFLQTPKAHLRGQGCPTCANNKRAAVFESHGERLIKEYLTMRKILFINQKTFTDCKHKMLLRYDFFIPKYNLLIEFDGQQHYEFVKKFHGSINGLHQMQERDRIKNQYAKCNGFTLLRILWNQQAQIATILDGIIS